MYASIIEHVRRLGWTVTESRCRDLVAFQATREGERQVAFCGCGTPEKNAWNAACALASACGGDPPFDLMLHCFDLARPGVARSLDDEQVV